MTQTMLLTKRLTTFLSQNTTSQLPTLLLLSPTGKLLSSSSPLPASTLRTQATLACSLWTLYQPNTSLQPTSQSHNESRNSGATMSSTSTAADNDPNTITIQLSKGIMVIRALACGLLFVAIGPSTTISSPHPSSHTLQAQALLNSSRHTSPPSSPPAVDGHGPEREIDSLVVPGSAAPSDTGSVRSTGTRSGSMAGVKRQATEVGKWLDSQLDGFQLSFGEVR